MLVVFNKSTKTKNLNKVRNILIILPLLISLTISCDTKKAQQANGNYHTVQFDAPFKMNQKKGVQFENNDLKILFDKVTEESRCPEGTTCVWEGQVKVQLTVKTKGDSQQVEIIRKGKQKENTIEKVGDYTIYLMAVNPYPKSGEKISQEDYRISLIIKK